MQCQKKLEFSLLRIISKLVIFLQCFVVGVVHVTAGEELCHARATSPRKATQVSRFEIVSLGHLALSNEDHIVTHYLSLIVQTSSTGFNECDSMFLV